MGLHVRSYAYTQNVAGLAKEVNFDTSVTNLNTIKFSVFCYGGCWIMAVWIFIACRMIQTVRCVRGAASIFRMTEFGSAESVSSYTT